MNTLERSYNLAKLIVTARKHRGWSQEQLGERATIALRRLAVDGKMDESDRDLIDHQEFEVGARTIQTLEGSPKNPLATAVSRVRLLGVVEALGLDRDEVNRLAGAL